MKSVMWIAVVSIVLNSTMIGLAQGPEPPEPPKEPVEKSTRAVEQEQTAATTQAVSDDKEKVLELESPQKDAIMNEVQRMMTEAGQKVNTIPHSQEAIVGLLTRGETQPHSGTGRVLVIPGEDIDSERIMTITEDLTVMSRILDKKLEDADLARDCDWFQASNFLEWSVPVTKSIFLADYGVLFLKKVSFPLSPPVEVEKVKQAVEDYDPVWEQAKREMYFGRDFLRRRGKKPSPKEYDAEKVDGLKKVLFEALRHTANIRNVKAGEWVVFTVTGEGSLPDEVGGCGRCHQPGQAEIEASQKGCPLATVMTIRVKKSDVDAFAAGELDFDAFREKVQIYTY